MLTNADEVTFKLNLSQLQCHQTLAMLHWHQHHILIPPLALLNTQYIHIHVGKRYICQSMLHT